MMSGTASGRRTFGRVIAAYRCAYPDPLRLQAGEGLTAGRKPGEFSGWVWCTSRSGKSGWVPEQYLDREGDRCTMVTDYDATELTVRVGEVLELGKEESGWIWCTNREGESGWVPAKNLKRL